MADVPTLSPPLSLQTKKWVNLPETFQEPAWRHYMSHPKSHSSFGNCEELGLKLTPYQTPHDIMRQCKQLQAKPPIRLHLPKLWRMPIIPIYAVLLIRVYFFSKNVYIFLFYHIKLSSSRHAFHMLILCTTVFYWTPAGNNSKSPFRSCARFVKGGSPQYNLLR